MEITKIFQSEITDLCEIPIFDIKVQAGTPSPADGYMCNKLDLNRYLIKNPSTTFFVQVTGESMIDAGIKENDILVVDKSIEASNNKIIIAVVNNEFTVKRLKIVNGESFLIPENPRFSPIKMEEGSYIWGVVTSVIQKC